MILGADVFQVPAIEKSKDLGITTLVCSYNSDDPGMKLADKAFNVSVINKEKVLEICKQEKIDGIMTIASEAASITVAFVATKMGLIGYDYEIAKKILNKNELRNFFKKFKIITPDFGKAENVKEALNIFKRIRSPVIMKPLESSGSRGVFLIKNQEDIEKHFKNSMNFSFYNKGVIIEQYIEGLEVGGESLIWDNKLVFFQITNKYKNKYFVPTGHSLPSNLPNNIQKKVQESIKKAIKGLKLKSGALNFDVIINTKGEPIIIELGARLGGNCLPIIMFLQTGVDTIKTCIQIALGMKPEINFDFSKKKHCVKIIGAGRNGKIVNLNNKNNIKSKHKNIYEIVYDYKVGNCVKKFNQGNHRIGHVIFSVNRNEKPKSFFDKLDNIINLKVK